MGQYIEGDMQANLTEDQKQHYEINGYICNLPVYNAQAVAGIRANIEALEADYSEGANGQTLNQYFRVNGHVVIPLLADLARTPAILDAVESVLGENLLVWSVELFIKEAGTEKTVSWHQDITYWGMGETNDEVTAWVALSDVTEHAGCMRFIPGSHKDGIVKHEDTQDEHNLLSRGQRIANIDEDGARAGPLKPGEMSLHHGRCFHASGPNRSDDRRIGLAIRYVTPEVRDGLPGRDYAMLVRGVDTARGWVNVAGPRDLFHPADMSLYDQIIQDQQSTLTAGAEQSVTLYSGKGTNA